MVKTEIPEQLKTLSINETMDLLGVSRSTLWRMLNVDQSLRSYRVMGRVRVGLEDIKAYLDKHEVKHSEI